jgi:8-oxo-dGTP diphosphatase
VEAGESFADAAIRELLEETGIAVDTVGEPVASRQFVMQMPDGENVIADERLFVVHVSDSRLSRAGWTALEEDVMAEHRWWPSDELRNTSDTVWPSDIPEILAEAGSCSK